MSTLVSTLRTVESTESTTAVVSTLSTIVSTIRQTDSQIYRPADSEA